MYSQAKILISQSRSLLNELLLSKSYFSLLWGYVGMFCLNIIAYPLLTRLYQPQAFGELAIYSNAIVILSGIGSLSFEKAIVLAKSRFRALNLAYLSLAVLLMFSLLSGLLFLIFYQPLCVWLEIKGSLRYFWFMIPLIVFAAGSYQIVAAGLLRKAAFQELSLIRFLLRAFTLALQAGLVIFLGARYGLIIGFMSGFVLLLLLFFLRYPHFIYSFRFNWAYSKQSWQRFSDMPCYSFPQRSFYFVSSKIPFFLIAVLFSVEEVGYFSVAYGLLSIPEALISAALAELFFQRISRAVGWQSIKKLLNQYWLGLLLVGIIPFGSLFFYGEGIVVFVMGEAWRTTGHMLSIMAPMFLFTFISTTTSTTLTVMRRQKWELGFGMLSLFIRPLIFYAGFLNNNIAYALVLWVLYEIIQVLAYNLMVYKMLGSRKEGVD